MNYNTTNLYYHLKYLDSSHQINEDDIEIAKKAFPSMTTKEIIEFYEMEKKIQNKDLKFDIIVTVPKFNNLNVNPTNVTVENLIKSADKVLYVTGYSISDYFDSFLDIIISKIQSGVLVKMFLNDFESKEETLHKLLQYSGKYLEVYNFSKKGNGIEALHAKVICADNQRALITSANLSFNGLEKNIEIGTYIDSVETVNKLITTLDSLIKNKIVNKI